MRLLGLLLAVALELAGESVSPLFFIQDSADRYLIRAPGMTAAFTPQGAEFLAVHTTFLGANEAPDLHGLDPMGSTEQQLIHTERESFTICENRGSSHPSKDGKAQRRLDS